MSTAMPPKSRIIVDGSGAVPPPDGIRVAVCCALTSELMSSKVMSIVSGTPFESEPALTLKRSTTAEVVLFAIRKSGMPSSWLGVSNGLKLKKLKKKSLAFRSLPVSFVTVPSNMTVPPLAIVCDEFVS